MDRLDEMLKLQNDLQKLMPPIREFPSRDPETLMEQIRMNVLALITELTEMLNETGWKPWATSNHLNREAFTSETVDAWHFFMNLMLLGGVTADDLHQGYLRKRQVNVDRQAIGYDGVEGKCLECKRDYADRGVTCTPSDDLSDSYCEMYAP
jgi:dimeric dUTPase (all-alpha-NTP-PPase superfamily)